MRSTTPPVDDIESSMSKVCVFAVESINGPKNGVGAASLTNFQYHLKPEGGPAQIGI